MEIEITDLPFISKQMFVGFTSALGKGVGIWASKNKPLISSKYHVEFNIDEELTWRNNIQKTNNEISFIKVRSEGFIEIQGEIEDIEDNGFTCFMRLDNSLFMFSCANIPTYFRGFVNITTKNLEIYDTNI